MSVNQTGVFLDQATSDRLHAMAKTASTTPAIIIGNSGDGHGNLAKDEATKAWDRYYDAMNKAAVDAGLPEPEEDADGDVNNWGANFETREVLGWVED